MTPSDTCGESPRKYCASNLDAEGCSLLHHVYVGTSETVPVVGVGQSSWNVYHIEPQSNKVITLCLDHGRYVYVQFLTLSYDKRGGSLASEPYTVTSIVPVFIPKLGNPDVFAQGVIGNQPLLAVFVASRKKAKLLYCPVSDDIIIILS